MAVIARSERGKTVYEGRVVSRLEAAERNRLGKPVVQRDFGPDTQFLFSLSEGDMVIWKEDLWRVRGVAVESNGRLELSRASDARRKDLIKASGDLGRPSANVFCASGGRKVNVSSLGGYVDAHD
jgi:hypothetical protein